MYLAEIRGKFTPREERMEDVLTSNVFSFFKYAKREIFLYQFLKLLGLNIDANDTVGAEFNFWPTYEDGTEPDLVIIVVEYYLLFEAKLHSGFGKGPVSTKHQLAREIKGGKLEASALKKKFKIVAVTAHYAKHQFLAENPEMYGKDILWLNWHQIALLIYKILNENKSLDYETRCFAEDLYSLLLKKNLRKFAGVEVLDSISKLVPQPASLFFDSATAQYRGDFIGFMEVLGTFEPIKPADKSIFIYGKTFFSGLQSSDSIIKTPERIFFGR